MANNPSLVKTDSKEELQKELTAQLKGWKPVYQVNVLQKISGTGCIVSKKAAGITQVTKHDNQDCRKNFIPLSSNDDCMGAIGLAKPIFFMSPAFTPNAIVATVITVTSLLSLFILQLGYISTPN
jgi:hypothetical protein